MSCDGTMMVPPQNYPVTFFLGLCLAYLELKPKAKVTQSLFPPFHISCEPLQAMELFGVGTCGLPTREGTSHGCSLQDETSFDISDTKKSEWFCSQFWVNFMLTYFEKFDWVGIASSCIMLYLLSINLVLTLVGIQGYHKSKSHPAFFLLISGSSTHTAKINGWICGASWGRILDGTGWSRICFFLPSGAVRI